MATTGKPQSRQTYVIGPLEAPDSGGKTVQGLVTEQFNLYGNKHNEVFQIRVGGGDWKFVRNVTSDSDTKALPSTVFPRDTAGMRDYWMENKTFRDTYLEGNKYYEDYGKTGVVNIPQDEVKTIREEGQGHNWREFLKYGLGVKEDKLDKYTAPSDEGGFSELTSIEADDLGEWVAGEASTYEIDPTGAITQGTEHPVPGEEQEQEPGFEPQQIMEEEGIAQGGEDPRHAWITEQEGETISAAEATRLRAELGGPGGIQEKEFEAREKYRGSLEGYEASVTQEEDTLETVLGGLLSDYKTDVGQTRKVGTEQLDELLSGYLQQTPELLEKYGGDISKFFRGEESLRGQTGLRREEGAISDIAEGYIPEFEERIGEYRQQTGQEWKDIATQLEGLRAGYTGDVTQEQELSDIALGGLETSIGSEWSQLQEAVGGGGMYAVPGQSLLDALTSQYWETLGGEFEDIEASDLAGWYS